MGPSQAIFSKTIERISTKLGRIKAYGAHMQNSEFGLKRVMWCGIDGTLEFRHFEGATRFSTDFRKLNK